MVSVNTPSPPGSVLSLGEVLAQAGRARRRIVGAGLPAERDNERRLAWKRDRGIDTTAEERALCLPPPPNS